MKTDNLHYGPSVPASDRTHAEKHRLPGESFREAMNRIAGALKDSDEHFKAFREILLDMRFAAGGRVQASMGSGRNTTPYNCYVSGTIEDSFVDGPGSIMARAREAAATMRMGGGIGYDFSTLRPRGALIKKLGSHSSGPLSFMRIFNEVCKATASSGHRRGAQMGVLRIDHPDIFDFIHAKQNQTEFTGFNFSIGVTDEFMEAKRDGKQFALKFNGEVYRWVDPNDLWEQVMRATWDWGEPGVLFIDTINKMNNLWYCETIAATNPCGEQPLPPHGACLLGSFNLPRYLYKADGEWAFDWNQFSKDIPVVVRAMDNVVDRALYPLPEQEKEAKSKRRMGLGITGLANAAEAMGYPYGSPEFLEFTEGVLQVLRNEAYAASSDLAVEKGSFPKYNRDEYRCGGFIKTLPWWLQEKIHEQGIRNSHLLSIAPTGTMSFSLDNVSSGIEPVFSYSQERDILDAHGKRTEVIEDYGVRVFWVQGKRTKDVTIDEHLNVLAVAAKYVDSAVSKTCNVSPDIPWEDFKAVYDRAWEMGCKGVTTFNPAGKRFGVLRSNDEGPKEAGGEPVPTGAEACTFDPVSGRKSCE